MFRSASESAYVEIEDRRQSRDKKLRFGIEYLDDACDGIHHNDLVLLGAPSGAGKTQLCCNIALANMNDGKKVYYIALEASQFEIERRMKYPLVMERYYADRYRPQLGKVSYPKWVSGRYVDEMVAYEKSAADFFESAYQDLFLYYKHEKFGLKELVESILVCSSKADLIILDHVHYCDFDGDNENRGIKDLAKTVRDLALQERKPILLVAHLRKADKRNEDLVAGYEEFHGSSDLFKIATKVVTVSPGPMTGEGNFETYFRIPKNRLDMGVARFCAREFFSPKKGGYLNEKYEIGWAEQKRKDGFKTIPSVFHPEWARNQVPSSDGGGGY